MRLIEGKEDIYRSRYTYHAPRTLWHKFWGEVLGYGLVIALIAGGSLWVIRQGF